MTKQLKAVAYLRVSTKEQNEDTQLPDIQLQALRDNATILQVYKDKVSGLKDKNSRTGLNELLELTNADIDIVYIWEVSRLSREPIYFDELVNIFRRKHINICFLKPSPLYLFNIHTGEEDLTTSLALAIFSKFALFEIQQKTQRTQRGRNEAILTRNESYAYNAPFGYKKEDKKLVIDEDLVSDIEDFRTPAEIIRRIFGMYIEGKTLVAIARLLNEYNIPTNYSKIVKKDTIEYSSGNTISKDALVWRKGTIISIVNNTVYAGYKVVNTNVKTNKFDYAGKPIVTRRKDTITTPAIISEATFIEAQEQKKLNTNVASKAIKSEYLLRGILKCGSCGNYYVGASRARANTYMCSDRAKKNKATYKGCQGNVINTYRLDYMVWESVKGIYQSYALSDKIESNKDELNSELEKIRFSIQSKEDNIKINEKKIENIINQISKIQSDRAGNLASKEIERIDKEITLQEQELQAFKIQETDLLRNFIQVEELENFDYKDYDITGIESNYLLKKEAMERVVREVRIYEAKTDDIINATTYDGFTKIIVLHLHLVGNHNAIILYNPKKGDYIRLQEHVVKLDKERMLIGIETTNSTSISIYPSTATSTYNYFHPVEIYDAVAKLKIPKMTK